MVKDNTLFYLSGFISFLLFTFFLSLFFYMMFSSVKTKNYAMTKDNYVSVSIEIPKVVTKKDNKKVDVVQKEEQVEEVQKDIDVDDLFSDVWTQDIKKVKHKPKPKNSSRIKELQKQIKTSNKNDVESISEKITSLNKAQKSDETTKSSTGDEVNQYFAKIQALVYENFNPPTNSQGQIVFAFIELSALGKVIDFRILKYSSNEAMNDECDKIKYRIKNVLFPVNPDNKEFRTKINIISEE